MSDHTKSDSADSRLREPLFDLATLNEVHRVFEFEAKTDTEMDRWLHEQILRAQLGRDLTQEERDAHLDF